MYDTGLAGQKAVPPRLDARPLAQPPSSQQPQVAKVPDMRPPVEPAPQGSKAAVPEMRPSLHPPPANPGMLPELHSPPGKKQRCNNSPLETSLIILKECPVLPPEAEAKAPRFALHDKVELSQDNITWVAAAIVNLDPMILLCDERQDQDVKEWKYIRPRSD